MLSRSSRASSILFIGLLTLSACGGGNGEASCAQEYWNGQIGVCIPEGWKVMERDQLDQRGVPEEVVAAFQAEEPVSGSYPTAVVTEELLNQVLDSPAYSRANVQAVTALPGYESIDSRTVTVDAKEVSMHIYTLQPAADQPRTRFYQVSAVSASGTGYTLTVSTPFSVAKPLDTQAQAIARSLTFEERE